MRRRFTERRKKQQTQLICLSSQGNLAIIEKLWPSRANERKVITHRMFKPFVPYIDFDAIFEPPDNAPQEIRKICARWRNFIKHCYIRDMEGSLDIRVRARHGGEEDHTRKEDFKFFRYWKNLISGGIIIEFPPVEDLPVNIDPAAKARDVGYEDVSDYEFDDSDAAYIGSGNRAAISVSEKSWRNEERRRVTSGSYFTFSSREL
ncbi:hypothetical protein BU24DRAFT_252616 [Aaosphaeria arxii CBS 175.79]|uniref:Uncharacterized protein n=1 Tax=Aaosphaeria arxii CBS 175.79 TaxID=1450172 RepID=A0A6A5XH90_9PLEO|nr:uncharacterized protein BU24DRAFT_252616 [Aaosphaeria arxii CBS 175.79]KAF2012462.1 hypothetical protein BU24DRAFT_252616 [Aaosphaeria arxii CBS 175.79]